MGARLQVAAEHRCEMWMPAGPQLARSQLSPGYVPAMFIHVQHVFIAYNVAEQSQQEEDSTSDEGKCI